MSETLASDLDHLLQRAGAILVNDRATLRVTGSDAARWLNGMTTNSIQDLAPGRGVYSFFLNAQGRIQGDATIYRDPASPESAFLILTTTTQAETLHPLLDRFIIMDDVELLLLAPQPTLLIVGHNAPQALTRLLPEVTPPPPLSLIDQDGLRITTPATSLLPRFELTASPDRLSTLQSQLPTVSPESLEAIRLLEATPLFGLDIRDRDLPQETAQSQALHFNKGCYLGQEIVERIRSRGQVHRQLTSFRLSGPAPQTLPAPIEANGKPAGELTSTATLPLPDGPVTVALGYARREFLETAAPFAYTGGLSVPRKPGLTP